MQRLIVFILPAFLLLSFTGPVCAGFDLSLGSGYLTGMTSYQIGGHVDYADGRSEEGHFPLSELEFPLDAAVIKGTVDADLTEDWKLFFSAETNLTDDTGYMKDSDWRSPGSLDTYSESDTEMNMYALDTKISWCFHEGYSVENSHRGERANSRSKYSYSLGLGYRYQNYEFDVYDLDQWYPSNPSASHDYVSGRVLAYDAEYHIPYIELGMIMTTPGKFSMELALACAPLVDFKDEDQHLLRDKVNISDHNWGGHAMFARINGRYEMTENWYVSAEGDYMYVKSEGRSRAYIGGVYDHTIDHEIKSRQLRAYVSLGYTF